MRKDPQIVSNGILLLYHRPTLARDATTVIENIDAFSQHSRFKIYHLNTEYGYPPKLSAARFRIIVFHYSLFGESHYFLDDRFIEYLDKCPESYKIAFFQDEYRYCRKRFAFLNHYKVDCVYTLVEPKYFKETYLKYTTVPKSVYHLPGYVSEGLVENARRFHKPDAQRTIDIGYRGRPLAFYMGKGAQEKCGIAAGFKERAITAGLKLDIELNEGSRIYGEDWYRFTADCRGALGVESGVSIFDLDDRVRTECEKLLAASPKVTFEEVYERVLWQWEDKIPYRTISPRHFEAAAFRVCQILFEGRYSGILQPMVHYIPLKKDFSNVEDVIRLFRNDAVRRELTDNAYRDLIASGKYSYRTFIQSFDEELIKSGLVPVQWEDGKGLEKVLESRSLYRKARATILGLRYFAHRLPSPLRKILKPIGKYLVYRLHRNKSFDPEARET